MKITAITAACHRPEAWVLCEKYMARQVRQPDQWLVIDGDPITTQCTMGQEYYHDPSLKSLNDKILFALSKVTGDAIVFWENDDWYASTWLEWVGDAIGRGYDIIGEGEAIYYHVSRRWWSNCRNVRHASLCQTAMSMRMAEQLVNTIRAWDNPFFDCRLWRVECNKMLRLPRDGERRCIGIKGMPGTPGYSPEHRQVMPDGASFDPSLMKLWSLIGRDSAAYAPYFSR